MARLFRRTGQMTLPGVEGGGKRRAGGRGGWEAGSGRQGPWLVEEVSRRGFLTRTLGLVSASIATALGIPGVAAVVSPAFRKGTEQWNPIARLSDPGPGEPDLNATGTPILTSFRTLLSDAYIKATPQNVPVFVLNKGGGKFTIYDVRCTHLGCPVTWDEKTRKFYSPCHGAQFSVNGKVESGPPPRPLDRYEVKVENGVLYAGRLFEVSPQESI